MLFNTRVSTTCFGSYGHLQINRLTTDLSNLKKEDQQDATLDILLTSVSTCFGHHYAHLQENKGPVTAFGVLFCNKRENVDISRDVFCVCV